MNKTCIASAIAALAVAGSVAHADVAAYDHWSGIAAVSGPASSSTPAGFGNTFMGAAVNLAAGTTSITGFDLALVNGTAAPISIPAAGAIRLNLWIWGGVTPNATTTPVFSNLLSNQSITFSVGAAGLNFVNGTFLQFASGTGTFPPLVGPSSTPGIGITPVAIPSSGPIGLTFNWQYSLNGTTFVSAPSFSTAIVGGTTTAAPTIGTNAAGASPTFGYYRNASAEVNGNFQGNSLRQIGNNSGLAMRVYTIPSPGSAALLGIGGLVAARRRRA